MALEPGTRLGPYEIVELLGKGGMGEVYRAKDTKLGRQVAIKILLEEVSADPERRARFDREARVLASLNHPNLATLHGFETEGGTSFLVMELVGGETLAERIGRGSIPLPEAIPLFIQIAEGLEAAHDSGVIHRDLKPANIKVSGEGSVKILDFGLAKAPASGTSRSGELARSDSPTLTLGATRRGTVLGTVAYMSPEQTSGSVVDKRTDIWAFGCCLYEALSGTKLFSGDSAAEISASVLKEEPRWEPLPDLQPAIRSLLERCLVKSAKDRLRDIGEARVSLQASRSGPSPAVPMSAQVGRRRPRLAWLAAMAVLGMIAGGAMMRFSMPQAPSRSPTPKKLLLKVPEGLMVPDEARSPLAISHDGELVVWIGQPPGSSTRLYRQRLAEGVATPIAGTEGPLSPFLSPDADWVGFWQDGELKKVPLSGGRPATICETQALRGAEWQPDGTIFFGTAEEGQGLFRVSADGGQREAITFVPEEDRLLVSHRFPQLLPDGQSLLFTVLRQGRKDLAQAAVWRPTTGETRVVLDDATAARYLPSGHLVFVRAGTLWAQPFNGETMQIGDKAVGMENEVRGASFAGGGGGANYAVSDSGTLVFESGGSMQTVLVEVTTDGLVEPLSPEPRLYSQPRVSPDGKHVVVEILNDRQTELWVYRTDRGTLSRLTYDGAIYPAWSDSGQTVTYSSLEARDAQVIKSAVDGAGEATTLFESSIPMYPSSWSPDGRVLALQQYLSETGVDLWTWSQSGGLQPFLVTEFDESSPVFSPDGGWIAYESNESGRPEVYLRPFPGPGGRVPVSKNGGIEPVWSASTGTIFYRWDTYRGLTETHSTKVDTNPLRIAEPKLLFESDGLDSRGGEKDRTYDAFANDRGFVMIQRPRAGRTAEIRVILNWFQEVERLVPTQ